MSRPEPCTTVAARIEPSLYDQLTDLAARARCTRSALVRRLIKEGVKRTAAAHDGADRIHGIVGKRHG